VQNSNHLTGHALDGEAFVPGRGWVPLGTLLQRVAPKFGLRSGDQPGFFNGGTGSSPCRRRLQPEGVRMTDTASFSVKEIVVEIRNDVKELARQIDRIDREGSIGTRQDLADHENRLRTLESSDFRFQGAWATLGVIAGACAGLAGLALGALSFFA
jgi:hypothetical protein